MALRRCHLDSEISVTLVAKARDQLVLGYRGATLDADLLGPLPQLLHRPLLVGAGLGSLGAGRLGGPLRLGLGGGSGAAGTRPLRAQGRDQLVLAHRGAT